ncbi:hypothetical protein [Oceanibium sediminis]|uniref:hypothetical protein n=1 Tax=Oceanibium sediminis TaxID=2026339 RepID=UPI001300BACF|nr:hypothetical protein [Oceanibium sediminis]
MSEIRPAPLPPHTGVGDELGFDPAGPPAGWVKVPMAGQGPLRVCPVRVMTIR